MLRLSRLCVLDLLPRKRGVRLQCKTLLCPACTLQRVAARTEITEIDMAGCDMSSLAETCKVWDPPAHSAIDPEMAAMEHGELLRLLQVRHFMNAQTGGIRMHARWCPSETKVHAHSGAHSVRKARMLKCINAFALACSFAHSAHRPCTIIRRGCWHSE